MRRAIDSIIHFASIVLNGLACLGLVLAFAEGVPLWQ